MIEKIETISIHATATDLIVLEKLNEIIDVVNGLSTRETSIKTFVRTLVAIYDTKGEDNLKLP